MENQKPKGFLLLLEIAGLRCVLSLKNKKLLTAIERRYKGYLKSPAKYKAHFSLEISTSVRHFSRSMKPKIISLDGENDSLLKRRDFEANIKNKSVKASIHPSIFSLDALIRILWAGFLPKHNGLLLHSSAIVQHKKAYIFSGKSGAGKTTISRLSGGQILNDEIVALCKNNTGKWKVWGTPFWGEMGSGPHYPKGYPLGQLYFINKSKKNFVEDLSPMESLAPLMKVICFFESATNSTQQLLNLALIFLGSHPPKMLFFDKSPEYLKLLKGR